MRRVAFLLGFLLYATAVTAQEARELYGSPPGSPDRQCEDENGNTWNLPLEQYQAGMRPQGPCLPVGTWDRMRDRTDPGWRQRRQEQLERDLSAVGPETRRVVDCHRCVTYGDCAGVAKLRCGELPFVAEHCDRCRSRQGCRVDRRLSCGPRRPAARVEGVEFVAYRQKVTSTIKRAWSKPPTAPGAIATVQFTIGTDGAIADITLAESSRDDVFDRSATDAVRATGHLPAPPPGWPASFRLEFRSADMDGAG